MPNAIKPLHLGAHLAFIFELFFFLIQDAIWPSGRHWPTFLCPSLNSFTILICINTASASQTTPPVWPCLSLGPSYLTYTIIIVTTHNHYSGTLSLPHILCNNHMYTHSTLFTIFNFNFHSLSNTLHLILNLINGIMPNMTTLIYTWNTANILTGTLTF